MNTDQRPFFYSRGGANAPGRHFAVREGMVAALVLAATMLLTPAGFAQKDDFADGLDQGWTRYDPIRSGIGVQVATFSFPNGGYRIQTSVSPAPGQVGPGRAGALRSEVSYSDFFVSVDIVNWDPALDQSIGILARVDDVGLGTTDGYALTYQVADGDIDITMFRDEAPVNNDIGAGNDAFPLVLGRSYRFQFSGVGTKLTARVYELPNLRVPVAELIGEDATYSSGVCGLINFDNSGGTGRTDATYDNYLALNAEPPTLTIEHTIFDDLWVFWPVTANGFILQSTSSLQEPIVWTDICPPYTVAGTRYQYFGDPFNPLTQYYRLVQKANCTP